MVDGSKIFRITKKITNYTIAFLKWNNNFQNNSRKKINVIKHQIENLEKTNTVDKKK